MTEHNWKPGDVALVDSWRGKGQLAFRVSNQGGDSPDWCVLDGTDTRGLYSIEVARARPVVVIDPEDRKQVERLMDGVTWLFSSADVDAVQAALREFAAPTPPKPDEPQGLGAVVEDADGVRWVNVFEKGMWQDHRDRSQWREYREIAAVRVLSEGVVA